MVQGLGVGVYGSGYGVWGLRCRVEGLGFGAADRAFEHVRIVFFVDGKRESGLGFKVQGSGARGLDSGSIWYTTDTHLQCMGVWFVFV